MAGLFLDTSALVKLYVQEPGTDRLLHLASDRNNRLAILSIAAVEFRSAIRRREREGDIDPADVSAILESLQSHLETRFIRQPINDGVIDEAMAMVDRHALRAYDALQLAGCLALNALERNAYGFVCADRKLLDAAEAEQLRIIDPAVSA